MYWDNAVGMQVDTPFIEQHLVSCEGLRGYIWEEEVAEDSSRTVMENWGQKKNETAAMQSPAFTLETMLAKYAISPMWKQMMT